MSNWTSQKLRKTFLEYFHNKKHTIIESSSVVPFQDPTLLFTNSGMVQFKKTFLGEDDGTYITKLKRATSSQHCIRAGGKHNDLDDVGKDTYHHTFFEMLGNWSFGDYFKEDAIDYAYDFLINVLKLDKRNIYITYFGGVDGFEDDIETKKIWSKYFPEDRILKFGVKDNFWEMGDTGPCGPCTEIHYDRIGNRDASHLVNMDDPTVIEIWNLVFMQFYREANGLSVLKKQSVDTGMGLERVLGILNKGSNYQTDLFMGLFEKMNVEYEDSGSKQDISLRIIADHCRTVAVCLYHDVSFSAEGRGYVLRRIMRRLIKTYDNLENMLDQKLDELNLSETKEPVTLKNLIAHSAKLLELNLSTDKILLIDEEIKLFEKTLKKGSDFLKKLIKTKEEKLQEKIISGKESFQLYDTYGFPIDLTIILAEENNFIVDIENFKELLTEQKNKSRKQKFEMIKLTNTDIQQIEEYNNNHKNIIKPTITDLNKIKVKTTVNFVKSTDNIIFKNFQTIKHIENEIMALITEKTNFYGEKGGQVGDKGIITFMNKENYITGTMEVIDTQINNNYIFHYGFIDGIINSDCVLEFNIAMRDKIKNNHTGTHLLNYYIKQLYPESQQRGSLVEPDKLRYDFSLTKKNLTVEEVKFLEEKINKKINDKNPVTIKTIPINELDENVITLKDEKYPENVNMVVVDENIRELCGGTHVKNTGDIKLFTIISLSTIAANTKRIVAFTNSMAEEAEVNYKKYLDILNNGKTIDFVKPLSYIKKLELEKLNKKVLDETNKKIKTIAKENCQKIMEDYQNDKQMNMHSNIYKVEYIDCLSLKDNLKVFNTIGKNLLKNKKDINKLKVYLRIENVIYFILIGNNLEKLLEKIKTYENGVFGGRNDFYSGNFTQNIILNNKTNINEEKKIIKNLLE